MYQCHTEVIILHINTFLDTTFTVDVVTLFKITVDTWQHAYLRYRHAACDLLKGHDSHFICDQDKSYKSLPEILMEHWLFVHLTSFKCAAQYTIATLRTVPLKCNVALVRDSHLQLDHSQSTIEGVTYEKRPRDKFVFESLNSRVTINSY